MPIIKKIWLVLFVLSNVSQAEGVVRFAPGSTIVDPEYQAGLTNNNKRSFVTLFLANGNNNIASYIQDYIAESPYKDLLHVIQYQDGVIYDQSRWMSDDELTAPYPWLLTTKVLKGEAFEVYVESVTDRLLYCFQSLPLFQEGSSAFDQLFAGLPLNSKDGIPYGIFRFNMQDAINAAHDIASLINSPEGCVGGDNDEIGKIRPFFIQMVRWVLTGKIPTTNITVPYPAYDQLSRVFQIMLYDGALIGKGIPYDEQLHVLIDFIDSWVDTLAQDELPKDGRGSYINFAVKEKIKNNTIDKYLLKNIGLACLDKKVESLFYDTFSLSECLDSGFISKHQVNYRNMDFYLYTPN